MLAGFTALSLLTALTALTALTVEEVVLVLEDEIEDDDCFVRSKSSGSVDVEWSQARAPHNKLSVFP